MTTVATVKKEVKKIEEKLEFKPRPEIIVTMWCIDRGDGKSGFARFSLWNKDKKTPLSDEEVKAMKERWKREDNSF